MTFRRQFRHRRATGPPSFRVRGTRWKAGGTAMTDDQMRVSVLKRAGTSDRRLWWVSLNVAYGREAAVAVAIEPCGTYSERRYGAFGGYRGSRPKADLHTGPRPDRRIARPVAGISAMVEVIRSAGQGATSP